jgi:hypothetical protein
MIFVIVFSCLSRGPDDQGLSCGPGCDHRQGKDLPEAVSAAEIRRKGGQEYCRRAMWGHRWWSEQAIGTDGKVE